MSPADILETLQFQPARIRFPFSWVGHIPFIYWLIKQKQPETIVELGTHTGNSYFAMCQAVAQLGLATRCYAVDTWQGDVHAGFYDETVFEEVNAYNTAHYARFSTLLRTTFDQARRQFPNHSIDILHIDGLHTYEAVKHDFDTWFDTVKPGGYILLHDTAVKQNDFGVWRLWVELTARFQHHIHFSHSNGLGVIRLPSDSLAPEWLVPGSEEQEIAQKLFVVTGERLLFAHQYLREYRIRKDVENEAKKLFELKNTAEKENKKLLQDIAYLNEKLSEVSKSRDDAWNHLDAIRKSRSWRITRPLRAASRLLRAVANGNTVEIKEILRAILHQTPLVGKIYLQVRTHAQNLLSRLQSQADQNAWNELAERRANPYARATAFPSPPPAQWPLIDLTLVTHNSARWLPQWFKSLLTQHYPTQAIALHIVDNGSQDETFSLLQTLVEQNRARFHTITLHARSNDGFGSGHHFAIVQGSAPWIVVANPDLAFLPESLTTAIRYALSDTENQIASWELRQYPYEHPKHYDPVTLETHWSSHACILIRRSAYETVGGYEPRLFLYGEDVELSYRFRSHGYHLKYLPSTGVLHHSYQTPGESKPLQRAGNAVANTLIRLRYGTFLQKIVAIPRLIAFSFVALTQRTERQALRIVFRALLAPPRPSPRKGTHRTTHPIRGWDYTIAREGAFWPTQPLPDGESHEKLPLISLIIRTYRGREHHLRSALLSALHQTYPNIEILVSEDGGIETAPLIAELAAIAPFGKRIQHIPNPKVGRSAVANAALRAASGQYCAFLDDDDLLYADHFQTLYQALREDDHAAAAYALPFEIMTQSDPSSALGYREFLPHTPEKFRQPWDYTILQDHNYLPIQSVLFSRDCFVSRGGMDETLDQLEDWELWLRYGADNHFVFVPKTTSLFRTPADQNERYRRQLLLHQNYHRVKAKFTCQLAAAGAK